jgi:predicted Zn-dependent protease
LLVPEARDVPVDKYRLALLQILPATQSLVQQPIAWPWVADLLATSTSFAVDGNDQAGYRIRMPDPRDGAKQETIGYVVKRGGQYLVLGMKGSVQSSGEALGKAESGDLASARLWLDWAKEEIGLSKTPEPMSMVAFALLWPPKSNDAVAIRTAAAAIAARGSQYADGIKALTEARQQITDPEMQTAVDQAIAQGFLMHNKYADALTVVQRLAAKWQNSDAIQHVLAQSLIYTNQFSEAAALIDNLSRKDPAAIAPMRLRATLLAQQGKFQEAAELQEHICATSKASSADWNGRAWIGLFTGDETKAGLQAAEKANQLTQGRNPEVLHTLALVQASNGDLKGARATTDRLMNGIGDSDELFTIFGRIAEQLDLREVAASYYQRVKKHDINSTLSLYSFAQMRLKSLPKPARPAPTVPPV